MSTILPPHSRYPAIIFIFTVILWIATFAIYFLLPSDEHWDLKNRFAELGDAFGALNSLAGTLALALTVYTIRLQSQQLDDQKAMLTSERNRQNRALRISKLEETSLLSTKISHLMMAYSSAINEENVPIAQTTLREVMIHFRQLEMVILMHNPTLSTNLPRAYYHLKRLYRTRDNHFRIWLARDKALELTKNDSITALYFKQRILKHEYAHNIRVQNLIASIGQIDQELLALVKSIQAQE